MADRDLIQSTLGQLQNSTSLVRLANDACIATYSANLVSEWGDVLLVSNQKSINNSFLGSWTQSLGASRSAVSPLCELTTQCSSNSATPVPTKWILYNRTGYPNAANVLVDHCMATKAHQIYRLRFSIVLMTTIVACNIVKVICMAVIVWKLDPLVTVGDAIASFLDSPGSYRLALVRDNQIGSRRLLESMMFALCLLM